MAFPLNYDDVDLDSVARTVWGEARGEDPTGRAAVAWVIRNRQFSSSNEGRIHWYGKGSLAQIARRKYQFSCWNDGDPNAAKIAALPANDAVLLECVEIARGVLEGKIEDPTNQATHYRVIGWPAAWADGKRPCAVIGRHEFFKGID